MQKAKEYIDLLRRTIQEMDIEINDLRRALVAAGYPLPMPAQQQMPCGFPAVQTAFTSSSDSPCVLSEQVFNVTSQSNMSMDQNSQLSFSALGELAFGRGQFDAQDINSISHLQSVLSKSTAEITTSGNRPISPVSPYQLEQAQRHTSEEFKAVNMSTSDSLTSVPHQAMLGTHV
ncbi:hypothetical protein EV183_003549 [Coemansia sp. RSA 2336]|nr:hypothetical protein EV183_003549 [Coemansia sp. RSA 2336]